MPIGSRKSSLSNSPGVTASILRMSHLLMVINNFNIFRASLGPAEANPELFVDSNAVLTLAVTMQWFQHISGRYFQIIQLACSLELPNFPQGNSLEINEAPDAASACQFLGILTLERYDHGSMMTGRAINVKRYYLTDGSGERHNTSNKRRPDKGVRWRPKAVLIDAFVSIL